MNYEVSHLRAIESEAIHVIREVAAELERGVLLFSGGKDSAVLLHLALKAFWPAALPFPVMHVDTGHNFPEVLEYRDRMVEDLGARLVVASVQDSIDNGRVVEESSPARVAQPAPVRDAPRRHRGARLQGGLRRRPPRRGASPREGAHPLLPRRLRPVGPEGSAPRALEHLQRLRQAGRARARLPAVELDRARQRLEYIRVEGIHLPSIYFAHTREVFKRDGMLYATSGSSSCCRTRRPSRSRSASAPSAT